MRTLGTVLVFALTGCAQGAALQTMPADDRGDVSTSGAGGAGAPDVGGEAGNQAGIGGAAGAGPADTGSPGTGGSPTSSDSGGSETEDAGPDGARSTDGSARDTGVVESGRPSGADAARGDAAADAAPRDAATDGIAGDAATGTVGLAAYWRFDEGAGSNAEDSSGLGHGATLTSAQWTTGRVGPFALRLSGIGQFAQTTTAVVNTSQPYSVMAWVQLSEMDAYQTAVGIDGVMVSAFYLQYRPEGPGVFAFTALPSDAPQPAIAVARSATAPLLNVWYHIAGVFDGANIKLYVNGVLQQTVEFTAPWMGTGSTSIGRSRYAGVNADFWPGFIDDVRIYSRALSDAEVGILAQ
jgi:hypothetical protein